MISISEALEQAKAEWRAKNMKSDELEKFDANEARRLAERSLGSVVDNEFNRVLSHIKSKAQSENARHATYHTSHIKNDDQRKLLIKMLQDRNFTVKYETGYDQRDQTGWDYLSISW